MLDMNVQGKIALISFKQILLYLVILYVLLWTQRGHFLVIMGIAILPIITTLHHCTNTCHNLPFVMYIFRPKVGLNFVDHIVGNQPDDQMCSVAEW